MIFSQTDIVHGKPKRHLLTTGWSKFVNNKKLIAGIVFDGIIDNVVELMMDPFGNYLVQKLLDVCREEQKLHIVLAN